MLEDQINKVGMKMCFFIDINSLKNIKLQKLSM